MLGVLSLDVSKETLACALFEPAHREPAAREPAWERTVPNTLVGVKGLLASTPADIPWVLEPTGRFSLFVVKLAQAAGRTVLLAPPRNAKNSLKSLQSRAKTDRLDARGLGLYALTHPLQPYPVKTELVDQLDQLLAARKGLTDAITSLKLRIAELPHAAEPLREAVVGLEEKRVKLDRQIAKISGDRQHFPAVTELQRVPGIGPVTAAAAVSRLQRKQFTHPDQFVAYIGLDVGIIESGKRKGQRGLTKQGEAELRRLFYLCAKSTIRAKNSPFREQYQRELKKGRKKTAALCAVARKMARLSWSMVRHGTSYDPDRVYQQPKA
jgi:transposase